jgi:hypothetical protein
MLTLGSWCAFVWRAIRRASKNKVSLTTFSSLAERNALPMLGKVIKYFIGFNVFDKCATGDFDNKILPIFSLTTAATALYAILCF